MSLPERNNRVIVIDDNAAIHDDMRKILCPVLAARTSELDELEAAILGGEPAKGRRRPAQSFELDYAHQGQEGLAKLQRSLAEGRPYAMAFVDMRMPPGWDGLQTTLELWKASPELQIVICTAYSDYSWEELIERIGSTDRLVILKKPFESVEVLQLANALTTKWTLELHARAHAAELEGRVRLRTAELEETNDALRTEIDRRQRVEESLVSARDAAEAAARAKSTFLANMSHEVRTPMNGVIGMANMLLNTPLDEEQHDLVRTLTQSGEALLSIINDILDFSKVEAGKIALENIDFNLADELALAIDLNAESAAKRGIELILDIAPTVPATVVGDPVRVRQVLLNLVSNAIKFTEKGEVVVRISGAATEGGRCALHFEVADSGIGIAPESLATLFQPFMQADASMTRRFGGTGLGLAISRKLIEIMGGQIGARSEPGSGSTFWFDITLDIASPGSAASPVVAEPSNFTGRRVLVVDGNATSRDVFARQLAVWGVQSDVACSAEEARAAIDRAVVAREPYEVAIVDQTLAAAFLQQQARTLSGNGRRETPVAAVLTRCWLGTSEREKLFPSVDYFESKPVCPRKLRSLLAKAFAATPVCYTQPPAAIVAAESACAPSSAPTRDRKARILVVDDNAVNLKVAVLWLRKLGYDADVAANGREALEAIAGHPYNLVFMDAHMPELDGFEATRIIREAQRSGDPTYPARLPIIAMTAHAMAGAREECIAAGMDDYLPKPVRLDRLSELLDMFLSTGEAVPAAQSA